MSDPKRVSPAEAKALIDDQGYTYLDVRTEAEWAAGHPVGAHNVPVMLAGAGKMVDNPDFVAVMQKAYAKDHKLVVGCKAGGRSLKASRALLDAGFSNVIDQRAGFDGVRDGFGQLTEKGWAPEGLPVEKETPGASYAEIKSRSAGA